MQGSQGPGRFLQMPPSPRASELLVWVLPWTRTSWGQHRVGSCGGMGMRMSISSSQGCSNELLRGCPSLRDPSSAGFSSALWVLISFSLVSSVGCKEKPASIF